MTRHAAHLLLVSRHDEVAGTVLSSVSGTVLSCDHITELNGELPGAGQYPYDAVLVDVSGSRTSGLRQLRAVRSRFAEEPVIFLGDRQTDDERQDALSAGAQDFVGLDHLTGDLLTRVVGSALGRQQFISDLERERKEAESQAVRQSVVAKIGQLISSADELRDVYEDIAAELRRVMTFDRLALHLVDRDAELITVHVMASGDDDEAVAEHTVPMKNTRAAEAVHADGPMVMGREQFERDAARSRFARIAVDLGFNAVIGAPLVFGDRRPGVLFAGSREEGLDAQENLDLLSHIAAQMAGPVSRWVDRRAAKEQLLHQSIVARIGQLVDGAKGLDSLPGEFAAQLRRGMRFERLALHIIDWEAQNHTAYLLYGERREIDGLGDTRTLMGSKTEEVAQAGEVRVLNREDIEAVAQRYASARWMLGKGFSTVLGAPVTAGSDRIGVVFVSSFSDELAAPGNLKLMQAVADRIASPLARLVERQQTQERAQRQEIVSKIGRLVSTAGDLEDVYDSIAAELRRGMQFDRLAVHLIDWNAGTFTVHQLHGNRKELDELGVVRFLDRSITAETAGADGVTSLTRADLEEVAKKVHSARWALENGYQAVLGAPLVVGDRRIGVLYAASRYENLDAPANLELFLDVAREVAGPIAQWKERRAAERNALEQSKLASIASKLIQSADFEEGVSAALPDIRDLVPCGSLLLNKVNDDGQTFHAEFLYGTPTNPPEVNNARPLAGSVTEHVMSTGDSMLMDEEFADPEGASMRMTALAKVGYRSGIAVPLTVGVEPIGCLMWLDYAESRYSQEYVSLATSIGALVAGALANSELHRRSRQLLEETTLRLDLESENERLQVANEMKAQVISNVSHELRTPLTSMLAFADMLRRNRNGRLEEGQLEQLDVIRRGGRQLELIINDLLTTSSVDSGAFELVKTEFSIKRLVDNAVRTMQPVIDSRLQSIEVNAEPGDATVFVDSGRMTQVLCNLVSNASKYSPSGAEITVSAAVRNGDLEIAVADNGPGVPLEMREAVFDRYFRAEDEAVRAQSGTGLGLHIAKTIVEAHGGTLSVDPEYRGGARFVMRVKAG